MNTATDTLETNTPKSGGGYTTGQSATDLIGFYAATPIVQPSGGAQATIVYTAGIGTASATSGLQALTSSYSSTLISNAIVTLAAQGNAMRDVLVNLGLMKGSA